MEAGSCSASELPVRPLYSQKEGKAGRERGRGGTEGVGADSAQEGRREKERERERERERETLECDKQHQVTA